MAEKNSAFPRLQESDFSHFLQGFFGFFCGIVALFLFSFTPSLSFNLFDAANIPCGIAAIVTIAILLPFLRLGSDYIDTAVGQKALEIISFIGLVVSPLGLSTPLGFPCSVLFASGVVSASALWVVFLAQFDYTLITLFVGSAFALASVTAAMASLVQMGTGTAICICILMLASLICMKSCRKSMLREREDEEDELFPFSKQTRTAQIDRWTYSFIGLNLGVALCLAFRTIGNADGLFGEIEPFVSSFLIFTPILCASVIILACRTTYSYSIEKHSKDFLAATIAIGVMLFATEAQTLVILGLFILLCATFLQLIIVVNASIGFIRIQKLPPAWYLAEEAFVAGGVAAGVFAVQAFATYTPCPHLFLFCLVAVNSFLQVITNKGAFPVQTGDIHSKELQHDAPERLPETRKSPSVKTNQQEDLVRDDEEILPSVFRNERTKEHNGGGIWRAKVNYCCKQYKLSPRQCEIFTLLARGRDVKYIEEKLVISHATAKSHIYNIYLKLDVHSRQELIDLVESAPLEKDNSEEAHALDADNQTRNGNEKSETDCSATD